MKKVIGIIIVIIVLISVAIAWYAYQIQTTASEKRSQRSKKIFEEKIKILSTFADKYDAITDWDNEFKNRIAAIEPTFTIEVEDAIVNTDDRPVLLFARINDIVKKNDKYYLYLKNKFSKNGVEFLIILECTSEQAEEIMAQPRGMFYDHAVVARVTEVNKIRFDIMKDSIDENAHLVLGIDCSNRFVVNGILLDYILLNHITVTTPDNSVE